jgi:hypothetical protein
MVNYIPTTEAEKREFLLSLKANLSDVASRLNVDPRDVQIIDAKISKSIENIDDVRQKELDLAAAIQKRNDEWAETVKELVEFITRCKADKNYSKASGEQLGVEVEKTTRGTKSANKTKTLQVEVVASARKAIIHLKKPVGYHVVIYSRRGNESDFTVLKQVSGRYYEDARAIVNGTNSERREYCFTLIKDDMEGELSSIYTAAIWE